jgi:hypothetical protein
MITGYELRVITDLNLQLETVLSQTALTTNPERRQRVQTRMRRGVPFLTAWTRCKFGYQSRLVRLLAWLTLCPT